MKMLPLLLAGVAPLSSCVDPMAQHYAAHARAVAGAQAYAQPGQTTTITTTADPSRALAPVRPAYAPGRQEPVEVIIRTNESRGRY